jgi:putative transposase
MARFARVVHPECPYHVVHRGNRRLSIFPRPTDRDTYKHWLAEYSRRYRLEIWAYCLMPNHVHLVVVGRDRSSLARTIGNAHRQYAAHLNRAMNWTGHLWENRYFSTPLDERHLWAAVRYVENNPVRARLVDRAENFSGSSAVPHVLGLRDRLLSPRRPFPGSIENWSEWLALGLDDDLDSEPIREIRANSRTGRPTGDSAFIRSLEEQLGRQLERGKPGRRSSPGPRLLLNSPAGVLDK